MFAGTSNSKATTSMDDQLQKIADENHSKTVCSSAYLEPEKKSGQHVTLVDSQRPLVSQGDIKIPYHDPLVAARIRYYPRLQRVMEYLEKHIGERVSLREVADVACMERTAFCRFFSHSVGMTLHQFVAQWRIALAVERMLVSEGTLTELAYDVGYSNMHSFERAFRKITAMTPSAYRNALLKDVGVKCE